MKVYVRQQEVHQIVREWGKECLDSGTVTDSDAIVDLICRLMMLEGFVTGEERMTKIG